MYCFKLESDDCGVLKSLKLAAVLDYSKNST